MAEPARALDGVRVVDASRILAGPYCGMILGDLGATVVKIEEPERGDDTRRWGPPFTDAGESAYYLSVNRSKLGVALDLATPAGRSTFEALLDRADVLIENYKTATRESLGLAGDAPRTRFPRLVHAAVSGFGASGSRAARPGYDSIAQAESGLMSITGPPDGDPYKLGVAISDLAAGLHAAVGILAALRRRDRTGEGQLVDVSLLDASLGLLANVGSSWLVAGETPERWGNAHASIVPYEPVATADGMLMLAVGNDRQFRALCEALGDPALADDPRFATNPERVKNRADLLPRLAGRFRTRTRAHWQLSLDRLGVPAGPVRTVPEALEGEIARERNMVVEVGRPGEPSTRAIGPVPKLSHSPAIPHLPPPRIGEHTESGLSSWLGYDAAKIAALRAAGAFGADPSAPPPSVPESSARPAGGS
jgi:crotonobetainyl-CoA:carnitine CoA-transferase CaiB-like acyl-CoA transferase